MSQARRERRDFRQRKVNTFLNISSPLRARRAPLLTYYYSLRGSIFNMTRILIIFLITLLGIGCTPLTKEQKEERQWKELVNDANWANCEQLLHASNVFTIHMDHTHGPSSKVRVWDIKSDLMYNNCRVHLRGRWEDY